MLPPAFQLKVRDFTSQNSLQSTVEARLLDLTSEVGELAKAHLNATGYGLNEFRPGTEWQVEMGDALFSLAALANLTGVDLEAALDSALEKYRGRLVARGDAGSGR